jgi:cytoskeletal protein CcmA (bactofilin family)
MPIYSPTGFLDVTNATLRGSKIVTTSNVGVANVNPLNTLSVGSNLQVEDTGSNVLTIRGNAAATAMTLGVITIAPSYSLEVVSNIGNTVSNTIQFTNETTGFVSDSNIEVGTGNLFVNTSTGLVSVGNALSVNGRADLTDLHASNLTVDGALYANASTGRVGINTTSPGDFNLDVHGSANVGALTATDVIVTGNLAVAGEFASVRSTTVNVDDPIIGLANNNTSDPAVLDIGFVMARPSTATGSNVAIIFDESSDTLEIGYTTGKHTDTTITIDDSVLFHTNIHGNVAVSNLEVGQFSVAAAYGLDHVTNENNSTGDTIISTNGTTGLQTTANVSVGRDALVSGNVEVSKELTVSGNVEVSKELTVSGNAVVSSNLTVSGNAVVSSNLTVNGNVEVSKELTVSGNVEVSKELTVSGNAVVSSNLTVSGNVEVGIANLFVDTVTSNVGIGTNTPTSELHVVGNAYVSSNITTQTVTQTNVPAFRVQLTDGSVAGTGDIDYNSVLYDNTSSYDTATGRFTAPITGHYFFSAHGVSINDTTVYDFAVNDTRQQINSRVDAPSSGYVQCNISAMLKLIAGQYVTVYQVEGSTFGESSTENYNLFSGFFVG